MSLRYCRLFEINFINSSKPRVYEYKTHLVAENDVEGLTYDKANNRLLVAIKGSETNIRTYKGIYAFNLASKTMSETPVYKIELSDKMFKSLNANKVNNIMQPSEIAVHPGTGEIFITDAISGTLIKLNKRGSITRLYQMPLKEFSKAEGMTFSPGGKLFIANEGKKKPGNILEVRLNN